MAAASFEDFFSNMTYNNPLRGGTVNLTGNIERDMDNMGITIGEEGMAFMGMAYAACNVPGSNISKDFGHMNEVVVTAKFPRGYTPEMTGGNPDMVVRGPDHASGSEPTYVPSRGDSSNYGDYGAGNIAKCPDPELRNLYSVVVAGQRDWKGHLYTLAGSSENRELTPSHFKSYFAWHKTHSIEGEVMAKHFPKLTGGFKAILADDGLRSLMKTGPWVDYRTTYASAGILLNKMLDECPSEYLGVFSEATKDKIRLFQDNKWSGEIYNQIPEKALAILHAYLLVTEQVPEGLKGPPRHYANLTIQEKESLKVWFTEAKKKMTVYKAGIGGIGYVPMPRGVFNV